VELHFRRRWPRQSAAQNGREKVLVGALGRGEEDRRKRRGSGSPWWSDLSGDARKEAKLRRAIAPFWMRFGRERKGRRGRSGRGFYRGIM
jgi:hypothetical protein